MLNRGLYMAQRLSAMLMVPLVLGHLAVMVYAAQGGMSGAEILARTQGSVAWFLFYSAFAVAVAVHAAIGLRVIVHETIKPGRLVIEFVTWGAGILLLSLGARAVMAVTML